MHNIVQSAAHPGALVGTPLQGSKAAAAEGATRVACCLHHIVVWRSNCRRDANIWFVYMPIRGWVAQLFATPALVKDIRGWPLRRAPGGVLKVGIAKASAQDGATCHFQPTALQLQR